MAAGPALKSPERHKRHSARPSSAEGLLRKARAGLVLTHPFFGLVTLRLKIIESPLVPTMLTDGCSLWYNPDFVTELPFDELRGVLVHEVMHIVLMHHLRRGERESESWNIAADFVVNEHVEVAGFNLPADRLRDPNYNGKTVEWVYDNLPRQPQDNSGGQENTGTPPGQPAPGPEQPADPPLGKAPQQQGNQPAQNPHSPAPDAPPQTPDPGRCGGVCTPRHADGSSLSGSDLKQAERELGAALTQAAHVARKQGDLPAGIEPIVTEMAEPKVPWRDVLSRFVTELARNDYSWSRPNPRYLTQGLYLPAVRSEELGKVALYVDTSGSMSVKDMETVAGEMFGLLQEYQDDVELLVVYCDSEVAGTQTISEDDVPLRLQPKGGGGTDFRPPFDWAEEQGIEPVAAVYLTDGYCSRFPEDPPYPVVWALTQDNESFNPPFGETVNIN